MRFFADQPTKGAKQDARLQMREELAHLSNAIGVSEKELQKFKEMELDFDTLKESIKEYQAKEREIKKSISELETKQKTLVNQTSSAESKAKLVIEKVQKDIDNKKEELASVVATLKSFEIKSQDIQKKHDDLVDHIDTLTERAEEISKNILALAQDEKKAKESTASAIESLSDTAIKLTELQKEIEKESAALSDIKDEAVSVASDKSKTISAIREAKSRFEQEKADHDKQLSQKSAAVAREREKLEEREIDLAKREDMYEDKRQRLIEIKNKLEKETGKIIKINI